MPLPPEAITLELPHFPRRVWLASPLTTAGFIRARRRRNARPRGRGQRWLAGIGTVLMHGLFLAVFVLGPAYEGQPPTRPEAFLQVRLIDVSELPPPPPRGTPPRMIGPRHQGRVTAAATASAQRMTIPPPTEGEPPSIGATLAGVAQRPASAAALQPTTAPLAAPSPLSSAAPSLQPVPFAAEPPAIATATPLIQPPAARPYQSDMLHVLRAEDSRVVPASVPRDLPAVPTPLAPPVVVAGSVLTAGRPAVTAPPAIRVVSAPLAAVPAQPALQAVPLPAPAAPAVDLHAQSPVPAPLTPQVHAPALEVAAAQLEVIPAAQASAVRVALAPPPTKLDVPDTTTAADAPPPVRAVAELPAPASAEAVPASVPERVPAEQAAPDRAAPTEVDAAIAAAAVPAPDVSTAPDATPQGRDDAAPGQADGVAAASIASAGVAPAADATQRHAAQAPARGTGQLAGQTGNPQPGAAVGARDRQPGSYRQLRPHGDTEVMHHDAPDIGYQPTRFEGDWAPADESSIDTALRRAVEKTTMSHTFHLPRGVRVKCAVRPLLPIALLGCVNPDPPAAPVASQVYERLHLAPANPVVAPAPVPDTTPAPAVVIKLDNAGECAAARIAGGPPPPGCAAPPVPKPAASASSSWAPAGDRFD